MVNLLTEGRGAPRAARDRLATPVLKARSLDKKA